MLLLRHDQLQRRIAIFSHPLRRRHAFFSDILQLPFSHFFQTGSAIRSSFLHLLTALRAASLIILAVPAWAGTAGGPGDCIEIPLLRQFSTAFGVYFQELPLLPLQIRKSGWIFLIKAGPVSGAPYPMIRDGYGGMNNNNSLPSVKSIHLSVRSWFNVCSVIIASHACTVTFFYQLYRSSSINTIQGAFSSACLKRSHFCSASIPTNISTNSIRY